MQCTSIPKGFRIFLIRIACLVATYAMVPAAAHAQTNSDQWSTPAVGLRYLLRTTKVPCRIHALIIDLSAPGVRLIATSHEDRWQSVTDFAQNNRVAAAINGGFWTRLMRPDGLASSNGRLWPDVEDHDDIGLFALSKKSRAWISPPEQVITNPNPERLWQAVSGRPQLVRNGELDTAALNVFPASKRRHPRSAVGASQDGKTVIWIVASGRQGHSRGMSLYELAEMLVELGAHSAINLDGGGSSAMYVREEGGIVNSPSGGRWEARLGLGATREKKRRASKVRTNEEGEQEEFVRGVEREVMNHLGVIAISKGEELDQAVARNQATQSDIVVKPPRKAFFSMGKAREYVYPILYILTALFPITLFGLFYWWNKRRKSK